MTTAELPLHPPRYWRCQNKEDCGRKWHHTSMGKVAVITGRRAGKTAATDLFALAVEETVPVREEGACPACGAACEPEEGFVYGNHPPPPLRPEERERTKWSYVE